MTEATPLASETRRDSAWVRLALFLRFPALRGLWSGIDKRGALVATCVVAAVRRLLEVARLRLTWLVVGHAALLLLVPQRTNPGAGIENVIDVEQAQ